MKYQTVIGLEIHAELATKTKIYCSCRTSFGGEENTQTCPICTGMPGTLPVLNKKVVEYAISAGLAMNCEINGYSKQDRKNYFYPDLPKAYQTSQYDLPLCKNGYLDIVVDGVSKRVGITRIHIEEDAGKLIHDRVAGATLIDYNRCGVPLIEIVTEPDMNSPAEAKAFLERVKEILEYIGVCDCKMQEGSLRCDVNLSVRRMGDTRLGTRTEMKNINSFAAAYRAMENESRRQTELIEDGGSVIQSTRRWDDNVAQSFELRSKEEAQDYRYFPEPDLPLIVTSEEEIARIKGSLPILPEQRRKKYVTQLGLSEYDASLLTSSKKISDYFESVLPYTDNAKCAANLLICDISAIMHKRRLDDIPFSPEYLAKAIAMYDNGRISSASLKRIVEMLFDTEKEPLDIARENGLMQISDGETLKPIIKQLIEENPKAAAELVGGKGKAMGFFVGRVMKATGGGADPTLTEKIVKELLEIK